MLFSWEAELDGEMSLEEGDTIKLLKWITPEWIEGEIEGQVGSFPTSFVDIIEDV